MTDTVGSCNPFARPSDSTGKGVKGDYSDGMYIVKLEPGSYRVWVLCMNGVGTYELTASAQR